MNKTCLYIRGVPGSGKHTVARILERDLGWPMIWVHHFDALYAAIGEYRVPELTDDLIASVARYLARRKRNMIVVRPSRKCDGLDSVGAIAEIGNYKFVPVQLTADYATLATRVTRRHYESPFRITTKEGLDEYLQARPPEPYEGETMIATDDLQPEEVAERIKGLL